MTNTKNIRPIVGAIALWLMVMAWVFSSSTAHAAGHVGTDNVKQELRTQMYSLYWVDTATTDSTAGTDWVIYSTAANAGTSYDVSGSSLKYSPVPSRIAVYFKETGLNGTTNDTLACTMQVTGYTQFGKPVTETLAVTESPTVYTSNVYERVTRVTGSGCAQGTNASDLLIVKGTQYIGVPFDFDSINAIITVCRGRSNAAVCKGVGDSNFTSTYINTQYDWIDLETAGGLAPQDADFITIRVRPPAGI